MRANKSWFFYILILMLPLLVLSVVGLIMVIHARRFYNVQLFLKDRAIPDLKIPLTAAGCFSIIPSKIVGIISRI